MSVKYEIHSIPNSHGTGRERHFARIYEQEPMAAVQLESEIQDGCSLTRSDVRGALAALSDSMIGQLAAGRRFHLPGIGYFSLSVGLDLPEGKSVDKVRADDIRVRGIRFRPEAAVLRAVGGGVRFERAAFTTRSRRCTEEELLAGLTGYLKANAYINRCELQRLFALRKTAALKWLKHFTESGVLKKGGMSNSPVYFLAGVSAVERGV